MESNSRLLRVKVALGEADAALVYQSDVHGVHDVRVVPIPKAFQVITNVTVGAVVPVREHASKWLDFMKTDRAQELLKDHGFMRAH
jgi:ABC-type molybdate transport system substrate-binding protein